MRAAGARRTRGAGRVGVATAAYVGSCRTLGGKRRRCDRHVRQGGCFHYCVERACMHLSGWSPATTRGRA
eukprot:5282146-Pyramimonas_sp.AAC.1